MLIDQSQGLMVHPNEAYGFVDDAPVALAAFSGNPYRELAEKLKSGETVAGIEVTDYDGIQRMIYGGKAKLKEGSHGQTKPDAAHRSV